MIVVSSGGSERSDLPRIPIYTRAGRLIPYTEERVPVRTNQMMQIAANELLTLWPTTLRSISSYPYNCVGMIFASRRAWIDIDYIYQILQEDGYRQIQHEEIEIGDVVVYENDDVPTHVGLVIAIDFLGKTPNLKIMSKWGRDAEFIHFAEQVPYQLGVPTAFYTDRQTVTGD